MYHKGKTLAILYTIFCVFKDVVVSQVLYYYLCFFRIQGVSPPDLNNTLE